MVAASFPDQFLAELARCRNLHAEYRKIGPAGVFGAAMIEDALRRADTAVLDGDTPAMLRVYEEVKGFE